MYFVARLSAGSDANAVRRVFNSSACAGHYPSCGPEAPNDNFSVSGGGLKQGATVEMFSPEQLPVKTQLVEEFGIFNKYFTATPTASTPNHLFAQSATSCGQTGNSLYSTCGGATETYPQPTICAFSPRPAHFAACA